MAAKEHEQPAPVETGEGEQTVAIRASDGPEFVVSVATAKSSMTIKNMMEDLEGCTESGIDLPNIEASTLAKVIEFWNKNGDKKAAADETKRWKEGFFAAMEKKALFEVVMAANFLETEELLGAACQVVADRIKDMTVEATRDYLGIVNDFTPEEEAEIRRANAWAFDEN